MAISTMITQTKTSQFLKDVLIVLGTSILFGLFASISIPLPFTPVPISFTVQLILFFSVILGRRGAYATFTYLGLGAMGLPMFANGAGGIIHLFGPTGGYLVGFAIASYVIAILTEQLKERSPSKIFGIMLFGNALVYVFGLPHLALYVGFDKALAFGLYPFIGPGFLKLLLAHRGLKALKYFD